MPIEKSLEKIKSYCQENPKFISDRDLNDILKSIAILNILKKKKVNLAEMIELSDYRYQLYRLYVEFELHLPKDQILTRSEFALVKRWIRRK